MRLILNNCIKKGPGIIPGHFTIQSTNANNFAKEHLKVQNFMFVIKNLIK
jgi:hypothetical protein